MQRLFLAILIVSLPLAFTGCGEKGPKTTPVSITITQKGSPLAEATVTMVSADGKSSASAITDASGVAVMTTGEGINKKGALPGEYGIAVRKWETRTVPNPTEESPDGTSSIRENKLPGKYGEQGTSGFKLTVGDKPVQETFDIP
jgi:hypothetical protein